jgi:hypothetical protein
MNTTFLDRLRGVPKTPSHIYKMAEYRFWGHKIEWREPGKTVVGWVDRRPRVGDEIHCPMNNGSLGRYRITSVDLVGDPPDMFFATVKFVGLTEEATP